ALRGRVLDPGMLDAFLLRVDWGDHTATLTGLGAGTTGFRLAHRYRRPGTYHVRVELTDDGGAAVQARARATVRERAEHRRRGRFAAAAEALARALRGLVTRALAEWGLPPGSR